MTNVPDRIRKTWKDLYKLFDIHYRMKNTEADWAAFWRDATVIYEESGQNERVMEALILIADVFSDRMKADESVHQINMTEV